MTLPAPEPLILIVGAADTGRAPMAAALLRRQLARRSLPWVVASAGVTGHDDEQAEPEARNAMALMNLDISAHQARSLDDTMVAAAAVLLAVDGGIARVLRERYPRTRSLSLGDLAGSGRNIPDPFRMQIGAWMHYAAEIDRMLGAGIVALVDLIRGDGFAAPAAPAPPPTDPVAPPLPPERAEALRRCERLLNLISEIPGAIDWAGARREIGSALERIADLPLGPADLARPYTALIQAMLGLSATVPDTNQLAALRTALARLAAPIDAAALAALSDRLPSYGAG